MPRVSRHRSHRSRKHSRDPSDSEEDGESLRDRRQREDECSARVSIDPESEKRKSSHGHERRESLAVSNSDASGDHGKKRKERGEDLVVDVERWNGDEDDHKRVKSDNLGQGLVDVDVKSSRSSRKQDDSSEKNDERTEKIESTKRKVEKDSSRRESSHGQNKDEKERDRERRSESEQCKDSRKKDRELVSESGRYKDGKDIERERERGSQSGHGKDMKERDRGVDSGQYRDERGSDREKRKGNDQYKDAREREREQAFDGHQHRDGGERDRERVSEKDKERSSRRDRERVSGRDKERNLDCEKVHGSDRDKERGYEKDRDRDRVAQDAVYERTDDSLSRKHANKVGNSEEGHAARKDKNMNETQAQDVVPTHDLERGERQTRRRGHYEGKVKWLIEGRDGDDKKLYYRDDHTKLSMHRDERHEDAKLRDKYMDDLDRDHGERSARDLTAYKPDNKHLRDENKPLDSRHKRSRLQDNNHDGSSYVDDYEIKPEDSMGRKRYSDEIEVYNELNPRGVKGPREDAEKNVNGFSDKARPEYRHSDKFDSSPRVNGPKSSASSSAYRDTSKQVDFAQKEPSEERIRPAAASAGRSSALVVHSRVSGNRTERIKSKVDANSSEFYGEFGASVKYDMPSREDRHISPNLRKERSPSYSSDRRFSERTGYRRNLDVELGKKSNNSKDDDRVGSEKPSVREGSQNATYNWESTPVGSLSVNRTGYALVSSPNHLPPATIMRPGFDSPSVMATHDDDNRSQVGDRRSYIRHKHSGDLGYGRGHSNAWKTGPVWPTPIGNGFLPAQHGPPGYHPGVPQFPPPLFGVRPSMDLVPSGVSFHMHDVTESFPGHGRPFGWHSGLDQPGPPHMQAWDGRNGILGDESHVFSRQDWDQSRHLLGARGWEMSADLWKGQNVNINLDISAPKGEGEGLTSTHPLTNDAQTTQPGHQLHNKRSQSESLPDDSNEAKYSSDSLTTNITESFPKPLTKKAPELSNVANDTLTKYLAGYLSRIDISPDLANSELYEKCTSILGKSHNKSASTVAANIYSQSVEDGRSVRMKGTNQMLSSLFAAAKDSIFQRAMSLYKKQDEISKVKLAVASLASGQVKKVYPEASEASDDKQRVQEVDETASMEEEAPLANAIADDSIQVIDDELKAAADPGCGEDILSDSVICANEPQACESLMEDCMGNSCRIPNSPENTH